ncbi:putative Cytochrome bd2, subunit I [Cronobacter dublinensis 582]|nr:putative Cytochrome bd2, subunit I [Cronobacter dublinensis 582]
MQARRNHAEVAIPSAGSLYLRHNLTGVIHSLNQYPPDELPWVPGVFFAFRAMVGLGFLMIFAGVAGLVVRLRGRLWKARWLQRCMVAMAPAGLIAMLAGWVVTETGRQPWTIYGLLLTRDSASPVAPSLVLGSFGAIIAVYLLVFGLGLWFMLRLLARPPGEAGPDANPAVAAQTGSGITPQSLRGRADD